MRRSTARAVRQPSGGADPDSAGWAWDRGPVSGRAPDGSVGSGRSTEQVRPAGHRQAGSEAFKADLPNLPSSCRIEVPTTAALAALCFGHGSGAWSSAGRAQQGIGSRFGMLC